MTRPTPAADRLPDRPVRGRLPWRIRARSWWARTGRRAARRWAHLTDLVLMFGVAPLALTAVLVVPVGATWLPISTGGSGPESPPTSACTLIGATWSCTGGQ